MGQLPSSERLFRCELPPLSVRNNMVGPFNFMNLPLDLIVRISYDFLDPVTTVALSLACKDLRCLLLPIIPPKIIFTELRELLLLLENDATSQRPIYFCHQCIRLHPFDPVGEGPTCRRASSFGFRWDLWPYVDHFFQMRDCRMDAVQVDGSNFAIRYRHVRLVMNQHFRGAGAGLPPSAFEVAYRPAWDGGSWASSWSARVIDDEFHLSATHTLDFTGSRARLRAFLNVTRCTICAHVKPKPCWIGFCDAVGFVAPCYNVFHRSCRSCATDYTVTIRRCAPERRVITIVTYHNLGSCRLPEDPKWITFRGGSLFAMETGPLRDTLHSLPGSVRKKWEREIIP
ncbi:hypothetical protein GGR53DRAFT_266792 [Hypoxylon sp. FL1150]|nr:hypothetical protein GGR53DRAFT_266792 [Hypoxylon sp. FL1150]